MTLKVFELYSGIGGMHFALKESEVNAEVVKAIDINTTANGVYRKNFPNTALLEKNIQSLTENDFNKLEIDMILMSPPCQPHTRNGLKRGKLDQRSDSLIHIIDLIPKLNTVKYILLENVKGFEDSDIRQELIEALNKSNFIFQEFLLTPTQFFIPNSRLRYYLLAKRKSLEFSFNTTKDILEELPALRNDLQDTIAKLNWKYRRLSHNNSCYPLEIIVQDEPGHLVPETLLRKYGNLFDIVTKESVQSCCFTKGYGHFVEGTGSVLSSKSIEFIEKIFKEIQRSKDGDEALNFLKSLELRYFTPEEISKLMCFPDSFSFPINLTEKQKFRLLGNSINVHVVGILIRILIS